VSKAEAVQLEIGGKDYEINQSPSILNSDRKAGTTGAGMLRFHYTKPSLMDTSSVAGNTSIRRVDVIQK
jgi:hypothetical protein